MKKKKTNVKAQGFCFRCEHRARSLEGKGKPRYECGMHTMQVCGCYMFTPCKSVVTQVAHGYGRRPRFSPSLICAREHAVELFDGDLTAMAITKKKAVLLWLPKRVEKKRSKK